MSATVQQRLDQRKFGNIVVTAVWLLALPFVLATFILMEHMQPLLEIAMQGWPQPCLLGLPLVAIGLGEVGFLGFGPQAFGVISFFGTGLISFGGIGIISFGGVAVGVIAIGGGACGIVAIGGGVIGYVAVGGGACGKYVLAGGGKGRYVFDRRRQDPEAVEFFRKFIPGLRTALTV